MTVRDRYYRTAQLPQDPRLNPDGSIPFTTTEPDPSESLEAAWARTRPSEGEDPRAP